MHDDKCNSARTVPEAQVKEPTEYSRYFGGKGSAGVYQSIINQIPPHDVYKECFLGMGSIIRNKLPAKYSYGVEIHAPAAGFFKKHYAPAIPNFRLLRRNAFDLLDIWSTNRIVHNSPEFIYLDPPYPIESRTSQHRYENELTDDQHIKLCELINYMSDAGYLVAISTYPNEIYQTHLSGWRAVEYTSTDSGGNIRDELLYCNYPKPTILHDPRYIGENNDKRSDIKKRIKRNIGKIQSWEPNQRLRLLSHVMATMPDAEKAALQQLIESGFKNHE